MRPAGSDSPEHSQADTPEYPRSLNIAARLADGALDAGWGERIAFSHGDASITYAQVRDSAARWAEALDDLGVCREQRVLIALPDTPSFVTAFLGTIWAGAVAVPVNPYLPAEHHAFYLDDSRAVVAAIAPALADGIAASTASAPQLRHVVVFSDAVEEDGGKPDGGPGPSAAAIRSPAAGAGRAPGPAKATTKQPPESPELPESGEGLRWHRGEELLEAASPRPATETHCDEPAFWLYTSGSTGAPKAAIHLHHDIWVAAECWGRRTLGLSEPHVHLSASKLFFAYGLGNSLHCPMWSGGRTVLVADKPSPANMLGAIAEHGVTHFYAVPSFYSALLADPELDKRLGDGGLESLEVCVSAGEALPAPLCEAWIERTGAPLLDGIGSTELLHIFIANRIDDIRPGCSGRPIPGYAARVVGEAGEDLGDDQVGDLWVRGDSACAGYWNRHEASKLAQRGEWFVTGDKYRRDAEGYYWYCGRGDDLFKVHGKWVIPTQVEAVLLEHEGVREVAVVAGTDGKGLSCGVAFVVPSSTTPDDGFAAALGEHAAARLSAHAVPAIIELRDELPRTPTGKIQRYRLRETT
jgi:benzoate-CoA ligase